MSTDNDMASASGTGLPMNEADKSSSPAVGIPDAVEPKILVFADDPERKPRLYVCPKCGSVHSPEIYLATEERKHAAAREAAANCYSCKTHNECQYCGEQCSKSFTACEACRYQRKLDEATEIPDDGGPYCLFDGDTYFSDMHEAQDFGAEWVSPCTVTYPRIDADSVLENLLDDMHEDASVDDMDGVNEFYAAVEAFNKAQRCQSWFGDPRRKIQVPRRDSDASLAEDPQGLSGEVVAARAGGIAP